MEIEDLEDLERGSVERGVPIIGPVKGKWLLEKVRETRPRRVLELGTANGYSGCILGSEGGQLFTVEKNRGIVDEAWENFKKFNVNANVIVGDGVEEVKKLVEDKFLFDLIFIDFEKKKYVDVLEDCVKLCKGYIIADNIFLENCGEFKEKVLSHPKLDTEIVEIGDGLSFSRKV